MVQERPEFKKFHEKYLTNQDFLFDIEMVRNPPPEYIGDFFEKLKKHERYEELKDDFIYDEEMDIFAHILNRFPRAEILDLSSEEVFFYPFMSKKEIKQIFNIKSASDYLLWLRAEQVEQNPRLKRTFGKLKKKMGAKWSFSDYFDTKQYRNYLNNLKEERRNKSSHLSHGTIHSSEANGMCFKTPHGNIIVLSYALRYFLYYMNIFLFGRGFGIKQQDTFHSFLLAIRIMIGTESLDFELDPRGRLPKSIKKRIDYFTEWQMRFIIGHEYAHHYLGHLTTKGLLKSHKKFRDLKAPVQYYTYSQQCEFDADFHSISETLYEQAEKSHLINGAFYFFLSLFLYEQVEDYLFPKTSKSRTHPQPLDRLWILRKKVPSEFGFDDEELNAGITYYTDFMEYFLKEFLPFHVDDIERTGSVYLPNYRKKDLVDRLDF
jgi:hypothetical protein